MSGSQHDQEKNKLRALAKSRRDQLHQNQSADAGTLLAAFFLNNIPLPPGTVISGYMPIGSEIDPRPLMAELDQLGHKLALPITHGDSPLTFRRWSPETVLSRSSFGTEEPPEIAPACVPDILLVPLFAFDKSGSRLGFGKGHFDRTLDALRAQKKILAVGIAYAGQEMDSIPQDQHDQKLDWIITEKKALKIKPDAVSAPASCRTPQ